MTTVDHPAAKGVAQQSPADSLAAIVDRYAGMVYSTCRRVLGSEAEAADVVQETFYQFYRQADEITGSIGAWLHQVATRRAIDLIRQNVSRRRREEVYTAERAQVPDSWADVEPLVDEALDALPDDERELLVLHFLERRTMTEIAADYGISQPTVSRRVAAALDCLRAQLRARGMVVGVGALATMLPGSVQAAPVALVQALGKMSLAHAASVAVSGSATATWLSGSAKQAAAVAMIVLLTCTGLVILHSTHSARPSGGRSPATAAAAVASPAPQLGAGERPEAVTATGLEEAAVAAKPLTPLKTNENPAGVATGASGGAGTGGMARWTASAASAFRGRFGGMGAGATVAGGAGVYFSAPPGTIGSYQIGVTRGFYTLDGTARGGLTNLPGWPPTPRARPGDWPGWAAPPLVSGGRVFGGGAGVSVAFTNGQFLMQPRPLPFAPSTGLVEQP